MAEQQNAPQTGATSAAKQAASNNPAAAKPAKAVTTKTPATEPAPEAKTTTETPAPVTTPTPAPATPVPPTPPPPVEEDEQEEDNANALTGKDFVLKLTLGAYKRGELTPEEISQLPEWVTDEINKYNDQLQAEEAEKARQQEEESKKMQEDLLKSAEDSKTLHDQRVKAYGQNYVAATNGAQKTVFTEKAWNLLSVDRNKEGHPTGTRDGWKPEANTPPEVLALQKQRNA